MAFGVWRQTTNPVRSVRFVRFSVRLKDFLKRKNSIALAIFQWSWGYVSANLYFALVAAVFIPLLPTPNAFHSRGTATTRPSIAIFVAFLAF